MDELDEATKARIRRLGEAAPVLPVDSPPGREAMSSHRNPRISSTFPIGLISALTVGAAVLLSVVVLSRQPSGGSGASSPSTETASIAVSPSATASVATAPATAASGIQVSGAEAYLWTDGEYVTVALSITNSTDSSVKLVGVSSPVAALAGLYMTTDCPSGDTSDLCGKLQFPPGAFWRIDPGQSIQLRSGDGEIILGEFSSPVASGQSLEVTLEFDSYPPVTFTVVVANWSYQP